MIKRKLTIDTDYMASVYRNGILEEWDVDIDEALDYIKELVEAGEDINSIELLVSLPLVADHKVDVRVVADYKVDVRVKEFE